MANSVLERMKGIGAVKNAELVSTSEFFKPKKPIPTQVPIINIAFSGSLIGGITSGLSVFAGPSKHFKSALGLVCVRAYLNSDPEAICLFYDSEFGITPEYLTAHGIDTSRVLHIPVEHIEMLKFDIIRRVEALTKKDKVIIFIDSIGNIASKKEVDDAIEGKSAADMTRAKQLKSLFRMLTPHLVMKDIPCIAINHTYETQEMYSKTVMSGGTGPMYSANQVFIIGRSQDKDGTELVGYDFTINIEKSRFVKEKSKFVFNVKFDGGINRYSGLLDLALEGGFVVKPSTGWFSRVDTETGEVESEKFRRDDTNNAKFFGQILKNEKFNDFIREKYQISLKDMVQEDK